MPDPYLVLDLREDASQEDVRRAYLEGISRHPPEQAPEAFQALYDAYQLIKDDLSRARLRRFGMPRSQQATCFRDLVPPSENRRPRAGVDRWMALNLENT